MMASLNTSRLNEAFDLLTHPHRRCVFYHLQNKTEEVGTEALATAIADSDEVHSGMERAKSINEIKANLHHTHLPKLAEAGFITVGANMDSIALAAPDGFDRFLAESAPIDGYEDTIPIAD